MVEEPETETQEEIKTPDFTELPEELDGKVIYEQDLRAASHSNGRPSYLVGSSIDGPPPESPEDDSHEHRGDRPPSNTFQYMIAVTYLVAGGVALYVGIT